jgi:hypothetical protein
LSVGNARQVNFFACCHVWRFTAKPTVRLYLRLFTTSPCPCKIIHSICLLLLNELKSGFVDPSSSECGGATLSTLSPPKNKVFPGHDSSQLILFTCQLICYIQRYQYTSFTKYSRMISARGATHLLPLDEDKSGRLSSAAATAASRSALSAADLRRISPRRTRV